MLVSSCTIVRKTPGEKAFHFENNIKFEGNISKNERTLLRTGLIAQLEDSVEVKVASKIPWPSFPWIIPVGILEKPNPFNETALKKSSANMQNYMSSMGYRRSKVNFDTSLTYKKNQQRIITDFIVIPGPLFTIDSIEYDFPKEMNASSTNEILKGTYLHHLSPFSYNDIDMEISRLSEVFQNLGFYKISREDIIAEVDTTIPALMNAGNDFFRQSDLMIRSVSLDKKPVVNVTFRLRPNRDSTHTIPYQVGEISVYPDLYPEDIDSSILYQSNDTSALRIHSLHGNFRNEFIKENILLKPGNLFRREDFNRTLNNFNRLGAWQSINMTSEVNDFTKKINYTLKMQPAKRQFFSIDLEGSSIINTSQMIQVGTGRVGLANNFTLRNRNIGRRAIQLENNLRTGIEFNNFEKILSGEISLTNRLTLPWILAPVGNNLKQHFQQGKTIVSADIFYIDRFRFFNLNTFNTYMGYEWKPNLNTTWQFRPLNFEYTRFNPDSLFLQSIQDFPLLLYTYNNGLIIGMNALYNRNLTPNNPKKNSLLKLYAEESGLVTGSLFYNQTANGKSLNNLYRFLKLDMEFKHTVSHKNSSFHFRFFAGGGIAFNTASKKGQVTLPFFKSYIAGGPNSMRGWAIRKLGIGSNVFYDTVANGRFNDKYADMQLETNLEYRFNLFPFYGFWMRGAVFTDIGNIWFRNDLDGTLKNAGFKLQNMGRDLAVASGLGARIDFNYFLIRFDLGFPIKDPRYGPGNKGNANIERFYSSKQGGWFVDKVWNKPAFQFAIGYPF
jgi:outer membrane protein assembly factor BamA